MAIEEVTANNQGSSPDLVAEHIEALQALFPEVVIDGRVDASVLLQLLGEEIDDGDEKYGLNWHGKRQARQLALSASTGTLRPAPEDSVDWDTAQHLMIEGDNLEVLKLLQKSYARRVKLIYIDPPYNTGNDFIYKDNFKDSIADYLELTGQIEEGRTVSSNTESSGRFHTDWLNMMYPRLRLARQLLRDDGAMFISIDDNELWRLLAICDEIMGEESRLGVFVWRRRQVPDNRNKNNVSTDHEYVVAYGMNETVLRGTPKDLSKYSNPDNDQRGPWMSDNLTGLANASERPNLHYEIVNPETGVAYPPLASRGWAYQRSTMQKLIAENRILWPGSADGRPRLKRFLSDLQSQFTGFSTLQNLGFNAQGTRELESLFGEKVFAFPKPLSVPGMAIDQATEKEDSSIVLDFFAGSATTGHAIMRKNLEDGGRRRYVLIQLPEALDHSSYSSLADLAKERLRRAADKIREEHPDYEGDLGFRVFKLDSSNIRAWDPQPEDLGDTLLDHINHLKDDRSEQDVLYELLLKLGLDLCVPIETETIADKTVHSIGAGTLFACLDETVETDKAEDLALGIVEWRDQLDPAGDTTVVFRDSAFPDDITKTNLDAILKQHNITTVRSI